MVRAAALCAAALCAARGARAQSTTDGAAEQIALRGRWRLTFDLGLQVTPSVEVGLSDRFYSYNNPQGRLALGVSIWRAVHPRLDLGGGVSGAGPYSAYSSDLPLRCASGERAVDAPFGTVPDGSLGSVTGATVQAVAGVRWRPWGPRIPVHLVALAGVSLRALSVQSRSTGYCGQVDPVTDEVLSRRAVSASIDGARVPALVWSLGVQTHFGPREEWSFGTAVWAHHDGPVWVRAEGEARRGPNLSAVFSVGYTLSAGPALPEAAQARGRRVRNTVLIVVGSVVVGVSLVAGGLLLLNPP